MAGLLCGGGGGLAGGMNYLVSVGCSEVKGRLGGQQVINFKERSISLIQVISILWTGERG